MDEHCLSVQISPVRRPQYRKLPAKATFLRGGSCVQFLCVHSSSKSVVQQHMKKKKYVRRQAYLIVCRALGLGDELGIADVAITFCEQASVHHACRFHLHGRLHANTRIKNRMVRNVSMCLRSKSMHIDSVIV